MYGGRLAVPRFRLLQMTTAIANQIVQAAINAGVDPQLALAVAQAESGGNPNTPPSSAGAIGLFQLMPGTAAGLGVNPYDTAQNIQGGIQYLSQQLNAFGGNVQAALAAYNWGPGAVQNAMNQYGSSWLNYAPSETQNYVSSITSAVGATPPPLVVGDTGDGGSNGDGGDSGDGSGTAGLAVAGIVAAGLVTAWALDWI